MPLVLSSYFLAKPELESAMRPKEVPCPDVLRADAGSAHTV